MKVFQVIALIALLAIANAATASNKPGDNTPLNTQISSLVGTPDLTSAGSFEDVISVTFMINHNNEIVVIETNTENEVIDAMLKSRLNYKHIDSQNVAFNKIYTLPLRIVKG